MTPERARIDRLDRAVRSERPWPSLFERMLPHGRRAANGHLATRATPAPSRDMKSPAEAGLLFLPESALPARPDYSIFAPVALMIGAQRFNSEVK